VLFGSAAPGAAAVLVRPRGRARNPAAPTGARPGAWSAPELHAGASPTRESDVYGLASTLYTAMAGRPPFRADTQRELAWLALHATPPPVDVVCPDGAIDERVGRLLSWALSADPGARPSLTAFESALRLLREAPPSQARQTSGGGRIASGGAGRSCAAEPEDAPSGGPKQAAAASPTGLTRPFFVAGEELEREVQRLAREEAEATREHVAAWARAVGLAVAVAGLVAAACWALAA